MPAADDLAEYLEDQGLGTVGTDIFTGDMNDSPDNVIVLNQTGGMPPSVMGDYEQPGLQINIRNTSYAFAQTLALKILKKLHGIINTTIEGVLYHRIDVQSSQWAGTDEKNRTGWTIGLIVTKEIENPT